MIRDRRGSGLAREALGALIALAIFAEALWRHRFFIHDDAFISLRYARNLVEHGELVWNLGERIEGYSNFLHLLITAGLMKLGVPALIALRAINAVAVVILFAVTFTGARLVAPGAGNAWLRALTLIIVALTPGMAVWLLGGLEAVVVAAFLGLGTLALLANAEVDRGLRPGFLAGVCFALAVLTRMDAAVYIAGTGLALVTSGAGPARRRFVLALVVVGMPALVSLVHMAWRFSYYGEILPMTYYAKLGVDPAVRWQFLPFFLLSGIVGTTVVYLGILAALIRALRSGMSPGLMLLGVPLLAHVGYVIWAGGDHMPAGRVLIPVVVPAALIVLMALASYRRTARIAFATLAVATVFMLGYPLREQKMAGAAFVGEIVGKYIAEAWLAGSLVALNTVGATAYEAPDLRFIDMLGLNDATIARRKDVPIRMLAQTFPGHAKGDGAYVLSRKPDFIIIGHTEGRPIDKPVFLSDVELGELDEFARCYTKRQVQIPYSAEFAERGPPRPRPLVFTYYERSCP